MRHLWILLLAAATGCHFPAPLQPVPDAALAGARYGGYGAGEPLRATVWFDEHTGLASFDVNQPAHVAIFAFQPLGRIEMIYPTWSTGGGGRAFADGRHSIRTESRLYQLGGGRYGHGRSARRASHRPAGQTYVVLIASERPLHVQDFLATGTLPWLNHPSVTWNPFVATDRLARAIGAGEGSGDWTAAYHVIWPDAALARYDGRVPYTTVTCPGGAVVSIPLHLLRTGAWSCPEPAARDTATAKPRVPPTADSAIQRPRPRYWRGLRPSRADSASAVVAPRPKAPVRAGPRSPTARPPAPRPPARPRARPAVRPRPRSRPEPKPSVRPAPASPPKPQARPAPKPKPQARPAPKPAPKPKPKPGGGGGGGGGLSAGG